LAKKVVVLSAEEIAELDRQNPATARDGGYQAFIVRLQQQLRRGTQEMILSDQDQEDIARYAFDYQQGGWQDRLLAIFGRTLGSELGRSRS
jgi:hypothetical protein